MVKVLDCATFLIYPSLRLGTGSWCVRCFLLTLVSFLGLEAEMFLTYPSLLLGTRVRVRVRAKLRSFLLILRSILGLEAEMFLILCSVLELEAGV